MYRNVIEIYSIKLDETTEGYVPEYQPTQNQSYRKNTKIMMIMV